MKETDKEFSEEELTESKLDNKIIVCSIILIGVSSLVFELFPVYSDFAFWGLILPGLIGLFWYFQRLTFQIIRNLSKSKTPEKKRNARKDAAFLALGFIYFASVLAFTELDQPYFLILMLIPSGILIVLALIGCFIKLDNKRQNEE